MTLYFSNIEARDAIRRLQELRFCFGLQEPQLIDADVSSDVALIRDFLDVLRERQGKRLMWNGNSPELKYRSEGIDFIMTVSEKEGLSRETVYQAIYLLDHFMDNHQIPVHQLSCICIVCIVISGKILECDKSPKYRGMLKYIVHNRTEQEKKKLCVDIEELVLKSFSFDVIVPTEVNFLEPYLLYALDGWSAWEEERSMITNNNNEACEKNEEPPKDGNLLCTSEAQTLVLRDCDNQELATLKPYYMLSGHEIVGEMSKLAFQMLAELTFQGITNKYYPSLIAASILMAVRREHQLNFWTPTLESVTSYTLSEVSECYQDWISSRIPISGAKQPSTPPFHFDTVFHSHLYMEDESSSSSSEPNTSFRDDSF